jgi:hypothetical protein
LRPALRASFPAVAAALACVALAEPMIRAYGPTYDEPVHLAAGWTDLVDGRYRLNALDHPPLAEMWAALPLLAVRPAVFYSHPDWLSARVYHYADLFLYRNRVPWDRLLGAARRWNALTLSLLLAAALAAWAGRLDGEPAAWGAASALALCVPWISNAALVTTDGLSAALFFAGAALLAPPVERGRARWALAGAAAGAALAAKFNMILLPPLLACAWLAEARPEQRFARERGRILLAALCAVAALALAYRVARVPLWWTGLTATLERLSQGRPAYLAGRHGSEGWWWYFPAAILVKTPLSLLALAAGGAWRSLRRPRAEAAWLLLPAAGYLAAALTSKTQIGYRHVLPLYPFFCLWAGLASARLWRSGVSGRAALAALLAFQAWSVLRVSPNLLTYFNEAAGGPLGGRRWLADSNLDWGQDLPALGAELARRGNPVVALSYFGTGDPAAHGVRFVPVGMSGVIDRAGADRLPEGGPFYLAVSATNRAGVYFREKDAFSWLDAREPVARPGGTIDLFDLTADREGRERLAAWLEGAGRPGDARVLRLH